MIFRYSGFNHELGTFFQARLPLTLQLGIFLIEAGSSFLGLIFLGATTAHV